MHFSDSDDEHDPAVRTVGFSLTLHEMVMKHYNGNNVHIYRNGMEVDLSDLCLRYAGQILRIQHAALRHDATANDMYEYAVQCETGSGRATNVGLAFMWFKKAADHLAPHTEACYKVGVCFETGIGTKSNLILALDYYEKSAKLGNAAAWYKLGDCYCVGRTWGRVRAKNFHYGMDCYRRSWELGYTDAGPTYARGLFKSPIPATRKYALEILHESAKNGHHISQANLGYMYEHGKHGVNQDMKTAQFWYQKSAAQGYKPANFALGKIRLKESKQIMDLPQADMVTHRKSLCTIEASNHIHKRLIANERLKHIQKLLPKFIKQTRDESNEYSIDDLCVFANKHVHQRELIYTAEELVVMLLDWQRHHQGTHNPCVVMVCEPKMTFFVC